MGASSNPFYGLPALTLTDLRDKCVQMISDLLEGGQSYTLAGRAFTRANLGQALDMLRQLNAAIDATTGAGKTIAQARTYPRPGPDV